MHVAFDSECAYLIDLFSSPGRDLYAETACRILKQELRSVGRGTLEREAFKHLVLGIGYGMGASKLVTTLRLQGHIDIADIDLPGSSRTAKAKYAIDAYFSLCPEVKQWQDRIWQQVCKTRVLYSDFGRRRFFAGRLSDQDEGEEKSTKNLALSYRAQSTIVGLTNRAIRVLDAMNAPIVLQVHDELVLDAPEDQIEYWASELKSAMEHPLIIHGRTMTIPVEIQVGSSWSPRDMSEWVRKTA